jgi:flagellar motor protein MotB
MRRGQLAAEHSFPQLWSVSFADLMMLLLSFFVLRYALAAPKPGEVPAAMEEPTAAAPAPPPPGMMESRLRFDNLFSDPAGAELSFSGTATVRALAQRVRSKGLSLELVLYTREEGSGESGRIAAWTLTERRARALVRQILDAGVDPSRLRLGSKILRGGIDQGFHGVEFAVAAS